MPHVDSHTPGTINWIDFVSTDLDAATGFYTGLFGWETEDMPMPGGEGIYRFFRLDGRDAAAGGTLPAEMAAQGIPSHWNVWVATDSAEEVVRKAAAAGGQVLMAPATLGPSGTLGMVADPGGAAIGVWQADQHIGAGVVEEPGAMTWWEVNTRAFEDCRRFYGQVFGWDAEPLDAPGVNYVTWKLGDRTVGGMLEMNEQWEGIAAHWMTYLAVPDTDDAAKRATELGGSVGAAPFDTAYGRIAVLADPAGGHFSVITPVRQSAG
jgi:predicted enzyme related to lactoylglutathione lyase